MTCDFTSFSTIFQLYKDDGKLVMKGCAQLNLTVRAGLEPEKTRSAGKLNPLNYKDSYALL